MPAPTTTCLASGSWTPPSTSCFAGKAKANCPLSGTAPRYDNNARCHRACPAVIYGLCCVCRSVVPCLQSVKGCPPQSCHMAPGRSPATAAHASTHGAAGPATLGGRALLQVGRLLFPGYQKPLVDATVETVMIKSKPQLNNFSCPTVALFACSTVHHQPEGCRCARRLHPRFVDCSFVRICLAVCPDCCESQCICNLAKNLRGLLAAAQSAALLLSPLQSPHHLRPYHPHQSHPPRSRHLSLLSRPLLNRLPPRLFRPPHSHPPVHRCV